jgi:hypothetical protein
MEQLLAIYDQIALWVSQGALGLNRLFRLHEFALWLNTIPFRRWLTAITQNNLYALPLIQWVHIIGASVICGSVVMMSLRMMGLLRFSPPLADMARRLLPWTWGAIAVNVATGIIMVIDRPTRALDATSFPYKMLFLIVATLLSIYFAITLRRDPEYWEKSARHRAMARVVGALSVVLWLGIIIAGRWIFYSRIPNSLLAPRAAL